MAGKIPPPLPRFLGDSVRKSRVIEGRPFEKIS